MINLNDIERWLSADFLYVSLAVLAANLRGLLKLLLQNGSRKFRNHVESSLTYGGGGIEVLVFVPLYLHRSLSSRRVDLVRARLESNLETCPDQFLLALLVCCKLILGDVVAAAAIALLINEEMFENRAAVFYPPWKNSYGRVTALLRVSLADCATSPPYLETEAAQCGGSSAQIKLKRAMEIYSALSAAVFKFLSFLSL